jgi:gamma-glutamyl phosphate reductase
VNAERRRRRRRKRAQLTSVLVLDGDIDVFAERGSRAAVGDTAEFAQPPVFVAVAAVPCSMWVRARRAGLVT